MCGEPGSNRLEAVVFAQRRGVLATRPSHGIFVETRLRHLLASGQVETRVIAPVPWFPFRHTMFGEYAKHAAVPRHEVRNGIHIDRPRYLLLPKIGMNSAPYTLARTGLAAAKRLIASGYDFDLIDGHYFYPDGVAAPEVGVLMDDRSADGIVRAIARLRHALPARRATRAYAE